MGYKECKKGLQWVTSRYRCLQVITLGNRGLQGFKKVTRGHRKLQGATWGYQGLPGARGG